MNEGTGMWKRQETKRPNSLQIPEAKRPRNQEDKSHKTCNNNAKKAKTTKSAADQESKNKKIGKLPFRNMCIYAHSLGSLGCYLQAVPFFWHDLNLTACADLRWNLPFPPALPRSTNLPWSEYPFDRFDLKDAWKEERSPDGPTHVGGPNWCLHFSERTWYD